MKKAPLLITAILLITVVLFLTVSSQKNRTLTKESTYTYTNENLTISFKNPSHWRIDAQERFSHAVGLVSGVKEYIFFDYQSESFDEYENRNKDYIKEGKITVTETDLVDYPAKEYRMHGAINYILNIGGKFVMINTESELTPQQKDGLKVILDSLNFNSL